MAKIATIRSGLGTTRTLMLIHAAAVEIGEVIVSSGHALVAINAADADAENAYAFRGRVEFDKEANLEVNAGEKIYWDATNLVATKTAQANTLVGPAVENSAAADTTVLVELGENR